MLLCFIKFLPDLKQDSLVCGQYYNIDVPSWFYVMYKAFQKYVWADILRGYVEVYINLKITKPSAALWT